MEATQAPATTSPAAPAAPPTFNKKPQNRRRRKKVIRTIILIAVILAILAGVGYALWYFVFREDETVGMPLTDWAYTGSIQSVAQGYGNAMPMETAAITLPAGGTVQDVYVTVGQTVWAGDPLYAIDSQDAQDKITAAEKNVQTIQEQIDAVYRQQANLTVTAPFSGKLIDVQEFSANASVFEGTQLATLVDDGTMTLSLYFSYAYEGSIYAGQSATITVPSAMGTFSGKVDAVHYVQFVSPEGGSFFEVDLSVTNPGTFTEGMSASATISKADGEVMYPYDGGTLSYCKKAEITAGASGSLLSCNLRNYQRVSAGTVLMSLSGDGYSDQLNALQQQLDDANAQLDLARAGLDNFNAVSPIDGTVISCTLQPGAVVKENETVITISNTTTMLVNISVDSRNIGFIQAGMQMELTDDWGNLYYGTVTSVDMMGEVGTGVTTYPVELAVDNFMGTLYNGSWLNYKLVTSQSDDCILIPNQCVKRVSDLNGEIYTVVFVHSEERPEQAIDVDASMLGTTLPTTEEGFWPIPVTTGISDTYNVEIIDGLTEGTEVFTNRETNESYGW